MFNWFKKIIRSGDVFLDPDILDAIRASKKEITPTSRNVWGIPAFRHVVDVVSAHIGFCGVDILKDGPNDERKNDKKHPAWQLLNRRANSYSDSYSLISGIAQDAIYSGNGFGVISKVGGRPTAIYRANPEVAEYVYNTETGDLYYKFGDEVFAESNVIHLRGLTAANCADGVPYGIVGRSAIVDLAETLSIRLAEKAYAKTYFRNSGGAMLVVTYPQGGREPTTEEKKKIRSDIEEIHGGVTNAHKVLPLYGGGDAKRLPLDRLDIEGPKYGIVEVVSGLGFSAYSKFGSQINQSYSSQEHESKAFLNDLNKLLVPFEEQLTLKLLREDEQESYGIEFDRNDLIDLDEETRSNIIDAQLNNGRISWEESRRLDKRSTKKNPNEEWHRPANIIIEGEETPEMTEKPVENSPIQAEKQVADEPKNDAENVENERVTRSKMLVSATVDRLFDRLGKEKNIYFARHKPIFAAALPGCDRSLSALFAELENVLPEQQHSVIEGYDRRKLTEELCKDLLIL